MNLDEFAQKFLAFRFRTKSSVKIAIAVSSKSKRLSGLTKLRLSSHFLFLGGYEFNWLLMIYSIFCTTKVSPSRVHQVLKIKLEKLILDHHIVVVVVMIIGL